MEAGNQRETSRTLVAEARDEAATIIDVAMRQARLESQAAMERGLAQARARAEADLHA
jgi:vacuolar-type H+-ATPase subunit H